METFRNFRFIFLGTLIILILVGASYNAKAKKVPGYLITNEDDTLYGEIKISHFNILTGDFLFRSIYMDQLHFEVVFRENDTGKFSAFKAGEILGFGFDHRKQSYIFQSFILTSNTPLKREKYTSRFLQLCYLGEVALYRDVNRIANYDNTTETVPILTDETFVYYEYYLYNLKEGLNKVEPKEGISTITDLLYLYKLEKEFIEQLPGSYKFKDVKQILISYDIWLNQQRNRKIKA